MQTCQAVLGDVDGFMGHHLFQKFGIGIERFGNAQALRSSVVDGELVGGTTALQSIDLDPKIFNGGEQARPAR